VEITADQKKSLQEVTILKELHNELENKLKEHETLEKKITFLLDVMQRNINDLNTFSFGEYYAAKRLALDLFKQKDLSVDKRGPLWDRYMELNNEGKRVKSLVDEQSAFALEQIDLAIAAMEEELVKWDDQLKQVKDLDFSKSIAIPNNKREGYEDFYKQLSIYNAYAQRINALRKELIKISARSKAKSVLFDKLSTLGDKVFPKRKELILDLSEKFTKDVEQFKEKYFNEKDKGKTPYYKLRAEIKFLQDLAKKLTINTKAFSQTRRALSSCWDLLREWETERKKHMEQFHEANKEVQEKINALVKEFEEKASSLSFDEVKKQADALIASVKQIDGGKRFLKPIFAKVDELLKPFRQAQEKTKQEKKQKQAEKAEAKAKQVQDLKEQIQALYDANVAFEEKEKQMSAIKEKMETLTLTEAESLQLDNLLSIASLAVVREKEQAILNAEPSQAEIEGILEDMNARKDALKEKVEELRKDSGKSGHDFEMSMLLHDIHDKQRQALEKLEQDILDLEDRLEE